ncbi:histidinol-phosphate transaminase [Nakamurella endophytica]|uniref:Aromatic amino acid aminotransferase n=1 Tax=Nakamurella endophytica TaxID=1748367 RepID=A0A917SN63_9ACTN|nr:histidinol-phosphate transaminase [Nakamurella endophytica]GGL90221.1 putative phenylalanine aminotransferase [Nakamurella endophytica]
MTVRLRSALAALPAYAPGRTVPGAVKLASNELPFPTLPVVAEAVAAAAAGDAARGLNRYPDNGATALVRLLGERLGQDTERIIVGCGSVALCQQLVQAVAGEGDEVLFGWRSFEAYPIVTEIAGARPVRVPVTAGQALDLDALAAAVTPRTRLVYVCTPNNPTGTTVAAAELERFLDRVPDDVLVAVDEAYREFDVEPGSPDGVEVASRRSNVVALRTLSKAYGLAGLRVGYAVGDPAVVQALGKVAVPFAVNLLAQAAAVAALGAEEELRPRWAAVVRERERVTEDLRELGYDVPTSQANFVWLPLADAALDFAGHAEQHGVIVRAFGGPGGGVRVTVGAPAENDLFLAAARSYPGR